MLYVFNLLHHILGVLCYFDVEGIFAQLTCTGVGW